MHPRLRSAIAAALLLFVGRSAPAQGRFVPLRRGMASPPAATRPVAAWVRPLPLLRLPIGGASLVSPLPPGPAAAPAPLPTPAINPQAPAAEAPGSIADPGAAVITGQDALPTRARRESERVLREVFTPAKPDAPAAPAAAPTAQEAAKAAGLGKPSRDYPRMFELTRRMLTRPTVRKFMREAFREELELSEEIQKLHGLPEKVKDVSQSQFMLLLQYNSKLWPVLEEYLAELEKKEDKLDEDDPKLAEARAKWRERFRELLKETDLRERFQVLNDPLRPMHLDGADGRPGYKNVRLFANHEIIRDGKKIPAGDLKKVVLDFIDGAKSKVMGNFFDFDLADVADAIAAKAAAGVEFTLGIDKNVIEARPQVKAVYDRLNKVKGVKVVAVDPVSLNHQKILVRDWDQAEDASSLFSSGNLTQSCIGPEGDCVGIEPRPKFSIPNANHMIQMDGLVMAQAAAHNLLLTLDYGLRGNDYPLGGAFKVFGEKADGAKEAPYVVIAFSPNGGLGDINRDVIRRVILESRGPVRMLQFAFSSDEIVDALVERARLEKKEGKAFDFKSVGDTPFAMQYWSGFLALSGLEVQEKEGQPKKYVPAKDNELKDAVGAKAYEALKDDIRVGPAAYRNRTLKGRDGEPLKDAEGKPIEVSAKIHHKVLISGNVTIAGTSFNFSAGANSNNEQLLVFNDPAVAAWMTGVFDGLFAQTQASVTAEAERRNGLAEAEEEGGQDTEDKHADAQGRQSRRGAKPK